MLLAGMITLVSSSLVAGTPALDKAVATWAAPEKLPMYVYTLADLNGDSVLDAVILIRDPVYCGSGGCRMIILKGTTEGFSPVSTSTITREPILLLPEVRHGWRTLSVLVAGGGALPGQVLMRFNGAAYPSNPSLQVRAIPKDMKGAQTLKFN
ncbi:MAG: hypothetical protein IPO38_09305 [Rhodocyclaceae bacterium]|nr:hypothetical protein [Rhodocyclaceae bacterium]